jgi:hypothetical protein
MLDLWLLKLDGENSSSISDGPLNGRKSDSVAILQMASRYQE